MSNENLQTEALCADPQTREQWMVPTVETLRIIRTEAATGIGTDGGSIGSNLS